MTQSERHSQEEREIYIKSSASDDASPGPVVRTKLAYSSRAVKSAPLPPTTKRMDELCILPVWLRVFYQKSSQSDE
jgi:hypothetical protein